MFWNKKLNQRIEDLEAQLKLEQKIKTDPKTLVQDIMESEMKWFDYKKLSTEEQSEYYHEAQKIIKSPVFENVTNHLVNEWAQWTLRFSSNYKAVRDIRMQVSALDLLKEELNSIEEPNRVKPVTDPYSTL